VDTAQPSLARCEIEMSDVGLRLSSTDHVFTGVGSYAIEFASAYQDRIDLVPLRSNLEQTLETFWPLRSKQTRVEEHS
jgi:hypothetical protein